MRKPRYIVRQYRRHTFGFVAQWFKVVDTKTKTTIRAGIASEQDARIIADALNKQEVR